MAPKSKNQKMSLGTFLTDENFGSWADEMEDMPLPSGPDSRSGYGGERRAFSSQTGYGNNRSEERSGFPPREALPLPTQPPYTAHLGNMSFDATSTDVSNFFVDCQVTNVRIVEDKLDHKPKGFGYVEFASLDGLKKALTYSGTQFQGRNIRISVAEPPKSSQDSSRDFSDWSRKGPLPDLPGQQRRVSDRPAGGFGGGRNFDNMSDAGSERASSRRGFDQGDGKVRDFGNWERKGPLSPAATAAPTMRESGRQRSNDDQQFRKQSPAWGERRSQDGSRPPRREFQDKPPVERAPTASEMDNQWRTKMRPDPPPQSPTHSREASNPPSPAAAPVPASRPKLNLQKRTVSEADPNKSASASATDAKASPFGAARPIDTFAREREIEEKRELAIRQKKEADDKAKAEKAEEKRLAKEREKEQAQAKGEKSGSAEQNGPKENGGETPQPGKSFEILRRATSEENGMAADEDAVGEAEETDTPAPTDDKAVKPKEIVREIPSKANGEWRKGSAPETPTESTATALEDEGWSTVSTKPRNNRRGNSARQPIAS